MNLIVLLVLIISTWFIISFFDLVRFMRPSSDQSCKGNLHIGHTTVTCDWMSPVAISAVQKSEIYYSDFICPAVSSFKQSCPLHLINKLQVASRADGAHQLTICASSSAL